MPFARDYFSSNGEEIEYDDDRDHDIEHYDEDASMYLFCPICKIMVDVEIQDHGIGPYEYWGAKGVHHDFVNVCPLCGTDASKMFNTKEDYEESLVTSV